MRPQLVHTATIWGVIGSDHDQVLFLSEQVQRAFEIAGFNVHEETGAEDDATILGGRFYGKQNTCLPTSKRYNKVVAAFRWLGKRNRVTGREVERLLGHGIFVSLLHRPVLLLLCHIYPGNIWQLWQ